MDDTLEIICEVTYEGQNYFIDKDEEIYKVAPHIKCPKSPIVSYKTFNHRDYYSKVDDVDISIEVLKLYMNYKGKGK